MYLPIFESIVGLMTLFNVYGNNTYHTMTHTRSVTNNNIPTVTHDYVQQLTSSMTSVSFTFDENNYDYLYSHDNEINFCDWYLYDDMNANPRHSVGQLRFKIIPDSEYDYWYLNIELMNYYDKVNLEVTMNLHYESDHMSKDDYVTIQLKDHNQGYQVYQSEQNQYFSERFFEIDSGILGIGITLNPVNEEQWEGTYQQGYNDGNEEGYNDGLQEGYANGYQDALDQGSTAATIFSGIVNVGLLPVNVFLGILNFEVFGINIGAFVAALMTVAIIIIIIRMFSGGGGKSD